MVGLMLVSTEDMRNIRPYSFHFVIDLNKSKQIQERKLFNTKKFIAISTDRARTLKT